MWEGREGGDQSSTSNRVRMRLPGDQNIIARDSGSLRLRVFLEPFKLMVVLTGRHYAPPRTYSHLGPLCGQDGSQLLEVTEYGIVEIIPVKVSIPYPPTSDLPDSFTKPGTSSKRRGRAGPTRSYEVHDFAATFLIVRVTFSFESDARMIAAHGTALLDFISPAASHTSLRVDQDGAT